MATYIDYTSIAFTDTQNEYGFIDNSVEFVANEIMFLATQDCYIRFVANNSDQILIKANSYMTFSRKAKRVWIIRVSTNGTLEMWAEGNLRAS
ncbi:MAG: hypothetical protein KAJ19_27540 [Gammaproteobacteria bacterium]|nr:hypothetical protein [Gammaproteobacteria bacterium]